MPHNTHIPGLECPSCESHSVTFTDEPLKFDYGKGEALVNLSAIVPVGRCSNCSFQFTDHRAEKIRHATVCQHLKRLTPLQIFSIRKGLGLSQAELSSLTGIGEASIRRWERGTHIQNEANDKLLFLLTFNENLKRLRSLRLPRPETEETEEISRTARDQFVFRALGDITPEKEREASNFQLRSKFQLRKAA